MARGWSLIPESRRATDILKEQINGKESRLRLAMEIAEGIVGTSKARQLLVKEMQWTKASMGSRDGETAARVETIRAWYAELARSGREVGAGRLVA